MAIFDKLGLLKHLRDQFQIDWKGKHGIAHWSRVRSNGLMLTRQTGANPLVVELFAFLHDARRVNERLDHDHGARGSQLAKELLGRYFDATDSEMDLLTLACEGHSDGLMEGDITVLTCWDADRLDLGRVGIEPNPDYLCTQAARDTEILSVANRRATAWRAAFDGR